ncbi:MAG: hypothetical protein ACRDLB_06600 [Actinomycetota bacterium]
MIGLITPRVVLAVLWAFSNYLNRAFGDFLWPFLGFLFLPTTTIGYAIAENRFDGVSGWGLFLVLLGFSLDIGLWGGSGRGWGKRTYRNRST